MLRRERTVMVDRHAIGIARLITTENMATDRVATEK